MNMEKKNVIIVDGVEYNECQVRSLLESKEQLKKLEDNMNYDYESAVEKDVEEYIRSHYDEQEIVEKLAFNSRDEWESELIDTLFNEDSVTGNASGSYTFNSYQAKLYLFNNMGWYEDACEEFGGEPNGGFSPESADVTIRCYLLPNAVSEVLSDLEDELSDKIEEYEK